MIRLAIIGKEIVLLGHKANVAIPLTFIQEKDIYILKPDGLELSPYKNTSDLYWHAVNTWKKTGWIDTANVTLTKKLVSRLIKLSNQWGNPSNYKEKIDWIAKIPGLGEEKANTLLKSFGSMTMIALATKDDLSSTKGIGPKTAEILINWFN